MKRWICVCCIAVLMFAVCTQSVFASDTTHFTELVTQFRRETHCRSISAVICDRAEVSYLGDSHALYQIGSMTKAFTGLAVQKLICEGRAVGNTLATNVL